MSDPSQPKHESVDERFIDEVANLFEQQLAEDLGFRIEDFIVGWPHGLSSAPAQVPTKVLEELILVEMSVRGRHGQTILESEYLIRFGKYSDGIAQALNWLETKEPNIVIVRGANDESEPNEIPDPDKDTRAFGASDVKEKPRNVGPNVKEQKKTKQRLAITTNAELAEVPGELGPYQKLKFVGEGGFGLVYQAWSESRRQTVALKFPKNKDKLNQRGREIQLENIVEEASKTLELEHPGIVRTFAVDEVDKFVFVVQEFVDGGDLKSVMRKQHSHAEIAELVAKIADALAYAHSQRIIHRDLKPANILIDKDGNPKLTDFGFAFNDRYQLSMPDQIVGTPQYMSPQLVQGLTQNLDGRTDIWSLGVILYEFLVKERPFEYPDTDDFNKIARLIETKDPKPLRQIDSSIDSKLEYICMKCLSKQARHRYDIAQDLADQLRRWVSEQDESQRFSSDTFKPRKVPILPKGLRSYGPEDAASFLQLLPGPRDYSGVPSSVRFWQVRIVEPVAEENRIPVGVIYGPSGSGKSSFVKAGLIPNLSEIVEHIYVEATREDTEVRILKALRRKFPAIPENLSLPETFHGISFGEWETGKKKLLIVLDQFEQRLSNNDPYGQSQLARALRHCDGQKIQCLLLIRDDFWLGLTRFADALEMDLLEGHNSQDIDLLDKKHACYVLMRLGQAYDCLRSVDEFEELESEQQKFIAEVVDQLAVGNYIICVRLTLFAELFKDREWSLAELKQVGGAKGVGETFLESTFGSESRTKKYQLQRDSAQSVLEALLPEAGTDIRGSMKTESELQNGAGLENRPDKFKELVKSLDQELKLITRTSPDESPDELANEADGTAGHFQLTHDYLVPSVRNWLTAEQRTTFRGRKRLQLTAMANHYIESEDPRQLPNWFDYAYATLRLADLKAKPRFANYWKEGRKRFTRKLFSAMVFAAVVFVASVIYRQSQANQKLYLEIVKTLDCDSPDFPKQIDLLKKAKQQITSSFLDTARRELKNERSLKRDLHFDLIQIHLGIGNLKETASSLIEKIGIVDSSHCDNILLGLAKVAELENKFVFERLEKKATQGSYLQRMRYVTALMFSSASNDATKILNDAKDRDFRSFWIHEFNLWRPTFRSTLWANANIQNAENVGLLSLALGKVSKELYSDKELQLLEKWLLQKWSKIDDAYAKSCLKFSVSMLFPETVLKKVNSAKKFITTDVGIDLVRIDRKSLPNGDLVLKTDLFVSATEISSELIEKFRSTNGKSAMDVGELSLPASDVSMLEAIEFCNWLNDQQLEPLNDCYIKDDQNSWRLDSTQNGFRLPFVIEYELFTQVPKPNHFYFGTDFAIGRYLASYIRCALTQDQPGEFKPGKLYQRIPTEHGLFDVFGNVQEWAWNSLESTLPEKKVQLLFGGSFNDTLHDVKPSTHQAEIMMPPDASIAGNGFRVVRIASGSN